MPRLDNVIAAAGAAPKMIAEQLSEAVVRIADDQLDALVDRIVDRVVERLAEQQSQQTTTKSSSKKGGE